MRTDLKIGICVGSVLIVGVVAYVYIVVNSEGVIEKVDQQTATQAPNVKENIKSATEQIGGVVERIREEQKWRFARMEEDKTRADKLKKLADKLEEEVQPKLKGLLKEVDKLFGEIDELK